MVKSFHKQGAVRVTRSQRLHTAIRMGRGCPGHRATLSSRHRRKISTRISFGMIWIRACLEVGELHLTAACRRAFSLRASARLCSAVLSSFMRKLSCNLYFSTLSSKQCTTRSASCSCFCSIRIGAGTGSVWMACKYCEYTPREYRALLPCGGG